jgi:hypothetical protein
VVRFTDADDEQANACRNVTSVHMTFCSNAAVGEGTCSRRALYGLMRAGL